MMDNRNLMVVIIREPSPEGRASARKLALDWKARCKRTTDEMQAKLADPNTSDADRTSALLSIEWNKEASTFWDEVLALQGEN